MKSLAFILGLVIGLGLCEFRRYRFNAQIQQMLQLFPREIDEVSSLPLMSRLRRSINVLVQQEKELQVDLRMWKEVLARSPLGYLHIDGSNQLQWCNAAAREMLRIERWRPDQVRLLLELVRSYELDQLIQKTRTLQEPQTQAWVFKTTQLATPIPGKPSPLGAYSLALRASTLPLSHGEVVVFMENQQTLVELTQARDRAFSDLTHELRTPLTSISLVAETLQSRLNPPEKIWVEKMLKEITRLISLIQDCLEISKLQTNPHQLLKRETLNLKKIVDGVWHSLEPFTEPKHLNLEYQGDETLELYADADRLTQVFLNIFDNSIKHSPPHTSLRVQVQETTLSPASDSWITIDIIDSGSGFLESDLAHVFERLYRGDSSRQRSLNESESTHPVLNRKGSGLGLSIVQQIIHAHGGTITAQNHPQTQGAWLQVQLPRT